MSASVVTPVVTKTQKLQSSYLVTFTVSVAAGDYATGGLACALLGLTGVPSGTAPFFVGVAGVGGVVYQYDIVNAKLKAFGQQPTSASAGVIALSEFAAAATPAAITGDTIKAWALFLPN